MKTLLALGVLLMGCGDDGTTPVDGGSDAGGMDSGGPTGLCMPVAGAADMTGQFAVRAALDVRLDGRADALIDLCPNPQTQSATLFVKMTTTGTGTSLMHEVQICEIVLPTVAGEAGTCPRDPADNLEVELSPGSELAAYLPTIVLPQSTTTLTASESGAAFNPSPFAVVSGAMLAAPASDPLPRWDVMQAGCGVSDDMAVPMDCVDMFSQVEDSDGDGELAVTLDVMSNDADMVIRGSAYAALRVVPTLHGTIRNDDCVDGTVSAVLEYSIIDSDVQLSSLALSTASVITNLPQITILDSSTFKMLRADGEGLLDFDDDGDGDVTCAEISAHSSTFER